MALTGAEKQRRYRQNPEVRERERVAAQTYRKSLTGQDALKLYYAKPEVMERRRVISRKAMARKRSEKADEVRAYMRSYDNRNFERKMFNGAKNRAIRNGLDFNLEVSDIVIPSCCPILGIPLTRSLGNRSDNSPSLDRIDVSLGYVKGNVQVISDKANRMKNNGTFDDMILLGDWAWCRKTIEVV